MKGTRLRRAGPFEEPQSPTHATAAVVELRPQTCQWVAGLYRAWQAADRVGQALAGVLVRPTLDYLGLDQLWFRDNHAHWFDGKTRPPPAVRDCYEGTARWGRAAARDVGRWYDRVLSQARPDPFLQVGISRVSAHWFVTSADDMVARTPHVPLWVFLSELAPLALRKHPLYVETEARYRGLKDIPYPVIFDLFEEEGLLA